MAYHSKFPEYIKDRFETFREAIAKKDSGIEINSILLVKDDLDDELPEKLDIISQLTILCFRYNSTMLTCWSDIQAAQYLHTLKSYESKADGMLQGQ